MLQSYEKFRAPCVSFLQKIVSFLQKSAKRGLKNTEKQFHSTNETPSSIPFMLEDTKITPYPKTQKFPEIMRIFRGILCVTVVTYWLSSITSLSLSSPSAWQQLPCLPSPICSEPPSSVGESPSCPRHSKHPCHLPTRTPS
mgnify:CR=1 FL=1